MNDDEMWQVALKRAGYALATIANHQMMTWNKYPSSDTPKEIIAKQIREAMFDAIKAKSE